MNRKLTLFLNETVVSQAKEYAGRNTISLSSMVERYFRFIISDRKMKIKSAVPRDIEELAGIISVPESLDVKKEYRRYRADKTLNNE